mgnify:FL=1
MGQKIAGCSLLVENGISWTVYLNWLQVHENLVLLGYGVFDANVYNKYNEAEPN